MMRVQIRDKEALESLTPENLRAYLESQGWGNDRPWGTVGYDSQQGTYVRQTVGDCDPATG